MPEAADLPFAFLRDLLARDDTGDDEARAETTSIRPEATNESAKAAMLDATVGVLAALRQLLQAAEDLVRERRDRMGTSAATDPPPSSPSPAQPGRERLDLTY